MKKIVIGLLIVCALLVIGMAYASESGGDAVIQLPPIVWAEGGE